MVEKVFKIGLAIRHNTGYDRQTPSHVAVAKTALTYTSRG